MTDMSNVPPVLTIDAEFAANQPAFRVDETHWGYIVHKTGERKILISVLQFFAMFFGACFVAVALGLMLMPQALSGSTDLTMRIGAAVVFGGMAAFLLWYASRGTQSEVQIDNTLGEVREVVRNRAGRPTLHGRYGYDAIGGVFLDRSSPKSTNATLVLRYRNTAQTLPVARGPVSELEGLRNRIGRDLMIDTLPETTIRPQRLIRVNAA